jgi:CRP-like cAMP-binding protein
MMLSDHSRIIRRLSTIATLDSEDRARVSSLQLRVKQFAENSDIIAHGAIASECCVILSGVAARYKILSGGRRQILSLHFPGDLPDLQGLHLERMDHGIFALTTVRAGFIAHDAIRDLIHASQKIGDILIRYALIDASIFREWIASIGRRSAYERIAHIFCEVYVRMSALGLAEESSFHLPMTQAELGDACGLSPVHVNRVLQRMRKDGLIVSRGDIHEVLDWRRLRDDADFDEDYLHLRRDDAD